MTDSVLFHCLSQREHIRRSDSPYLFVFPGQPVHAAPAVHAAGTKAQLFRDMPGSRLLWMAFYDRVPATLPRPANHLPGQSQGVPLPHRSEAKTHPSSMDVSS